PPTRWSRSPSAPRRRLADVTDHRVWLDPVGNGVARVSWSADLTRAPFEEAAGAVRREVERALGDLKQARVEAWVDPDDEVSLRIATWAGLHREGVMRGVHEVAGEGSHRADRADRVVLARLETDTPLFEAGGFRGLLNSFLPRKRAIAQVLMRDPDDRVLLCQLTYKTDWDLPGGVVEVGESPRLAIAREVEWELALDLGIERLLLTDLLPAWGGWDDAVCVVFDGGVHPADVVDRVVRQEREIKSVRFCTPEEVRARATDFTARRIEAALANVGGSGPAYTESGRLVPIQPVRRGPRRGSAARGAPGGRRCRPQRAARAGARGPDRGRRRPSAARGRSIG